jgi:putative pyruvate formate lyase activating enzyme
MMADQGNRPLRGSYLRLLRSGELEDRVQRLDEMLDDCTVCPRNCRVDRRQELGTCATSAEAQVASYNLHFGEEPVISGRRGSGTVFLANCNLRCAFCQNHDISQRPSDFIGHEIPAERLATIFLDLQDRGAHNINWVSPSHQVPQLTRALGLAAGRGLTIPIVYNSNGYDSVDALRLLDGIIDIYMPDLKFADAVTACELSGVDDYPERARAALAEMYNQVGNDWDLTPDGVLHRGLLIRMLVLPGGLAGIVENLEWVSRRLSPELAISLLAQYRPAHRVVGSSEYPDLTRRITSDEWRASVEALETYMTGDRHQAQGGLFI